MIPARTLCATAIAAALAAGVGASAATSATSRIRNCGTLSLAGKPWVVLANAVSCPDAKALVRKLVAAAPPGPVAPYPGTYLGMKCIHLAKQGKAEVNCLSPAGDKQVVGGVGLARR
jgi:hypothetical protein